MCRVRVANELGAGNGEAAKYATKVSIITSMGIGIFCWLIIMFCNEEIALLFSTSEPVLQVVKQLKLLLAFTVLLNSLQPVLSGNQLTSYLGKSFCPFHLIFWDGKNSLKMIWNDLKMVCKNNVRMI